MPPFMFMSKSMLSMSPNAIFTTPILSNMFFHVVTQVSYHVNNILITTNLLSTCSKRTWLFQYFFSFHASNKQDPTCSYIYTHLYTMFIHFPTMKISWRTFLIYFFNNIMTIINDRLDFVFSSVFLNSPSAFCIFILWCTLFMFVLYFPNLFHQWRSMIFIFLKQNSLLSSSRFFSNFQRFSKVCKQSSTFVHIHTPLFFGVRSF